MSKKVLVVCGYRSYYAPFAKFGEYTGSNQILVDNPDSVSLVVFAGGADLTPSMYHEEASELTSCDPHRDVMEMVAFMNARKANLPMAGICRGAQFLCAMAGGKLVQHVSGHGRTHHMMLSVPDVGERDIIVSSTHHQMMLPPPDGVLLGWATPRLSNCYVGGGDKPLDRPEKEAEVCFFPSINAVAMQYHPEMMDEQSEGYMLAADLCDQYLKFKK